MVNRVLLFGIWLQLLGVLVLLRQILEALS